MNAFTTLQDAIDHGLDYLGGNPSQQATRDVLRSIDEAYRDLANAFNWSYLYRSGRIITVGAYDSTIAGATITYLQESGTYPFQCTISGDTWPTWVDAGCWIKVGQVAWKVDQRKSATILTFDDQDNPGSDVTTPTSFLIYKDTYLLPIDFIAQDQALYERNFGGMDYTHPREWLFENRYVFAQGIPQNFTITGDRHWPGRLVMRVYPWPIENKSIDFIYKRRPRPLVIQSYSTGTVTGTVASSYPQTLTIAGGAFSPTMAGSVIRLSASSAPPSSVIMNTNPAVFETIIQDYVSPSTANLLDLLPFDVSGVGFTISDPIEIEPGSMTNAFLRGVERNIGMHRVLKDKPSAAAQYKEALAAAKAADSRSFQSRSVNQHGPLRRRLRDYPIDLSQNF